MADPEPTRVRHVVGCMTGTSLDGLDVALVRIEGTGLEMKATFLGLHSQPFDDGLRQQLLHLAEGNAAPPLDYMRAARMLGVMHAQAVEALLEKTGFDSPSPREGAGGRADQQEVARTAGRPHPGPLPGGEGDKAIDFVVAHGQTIWHAPKDTLSWQLFDPWPLVRHLGVPVCYDLRQADLIAGGEGAPLMPLADQIIFGRDLESGLVLNLGGVCNSSWIGKRHSTDLSQDVCLCNLLIDGVYRELYPGRAYDQNGTQAGKGEPNARVVQAWNQELRRGDSKSLGRESVGEGLIRNILKQFAEVSPQDLLRSAVEAVADAISDEMTTSGPGDGRIILAGGGARNATLVEALRSREAYGSPVVLSDDLGIPCEAREAMGFAVLGALSQDGVPITLPGVTGAEKPGVAGAWVYP